LAGQQGIVSDYELLLTNSRRAVRRRAIDKIIALHPKEEVEQDVVLTPAVLKKGAAFLVNAILETEDISLVFDGLMRVPGTSKVGDFHYIPMRFSECRQVSKKQRAMLDVYGSLVSPLQSRPPASGRIWQGVPDHSAAAQTGPAQGLGPS